MVWRGGRLIDCFLSVLQPARSVPSPFAAARLLRPIRCLGWLFIGSAVAIAVNENIEEEAGV